MFVEKNRAQQRYDLCKQCEYFHNTTFTCSKCGCFMKFKVKLEVSECPIKLWLAAPTAEHINI